GIPVGKRPKSSRRKKVPASVEEEIRAKLGTGVSAEKVAEQHGVSLSHVTKLWRAAREERNIAPHARANRIGEAGWQRIEELLDEGMTHEKIALEVGCSITTVSNVLRERINPSRGIENKPGRLFKRDVPQEELEETMRAQR